MSVTAEEFISVYASKLEALYESDPAYALCKARYSLRRKIDKAYICTRTIEES